MKSPHALSSALWLLVLTAFASVLHAADSADIQILSATVRDQKIPGATVIMQKNGEQSYATTTNAAGRAQVRESLANDPSVLLIVRNEGYSDLVAKCPCGDMTYAISPTMRSLDGMRIVLNWGATPADLDGHLAYGANHVWFAKQQGDDAQLDVDHINGFGPETITVLRKHAGERYVYAVQNYTDKKDPTSQSLSWSSAKVFVYVGQTLIRAYYVPKDQTGNVWTVFAVSEDGDLQDINKFSGISAPDASDLTVERLFGAKTAPAYPVAGYQPLPPLPASATAKRQNTQGETAYHSGDYATAIRLFQTAIDLDSNYGQAYSNLGLVFQKTGRVAEALWANRKAIALASGPQAANTRANTHFNNGKIYEDAQQWGDALREYQAAQAEKSNPTYDTAAQRMRDHGAH
jgi:tetratricopeptide (TPR) repeat protein